MTLEYSHSHRADGQFGRDTLIEFPPLVFYAWALGGEVPTAAIWIDSLGNFLPAALGVVQAGSWLAVSKLHTRVAECRTLARNRPTKWVLATSRTGFQRSTVLASSNTPRLYACYYGQAERGSNVSEGSNRNYVVRKLSLRHHIQTAVAQETNYAAAFI